MKKSSFPMGFWNYQKPEAIGVQDVKYWDECGMTLTFSPSYNPDTSKKEDMLATMDECAARGIKLIICDSRVIWFGASTDPDGYRRRFRAAYEDFGHHPATFGFHIGDEPNRQNTEDVIAAYNIQLEEAPELTPFINFLPFWEGEYVGYKDVDEWISDVMPRANLKLLCYDRYTQQLPEVEGTDAYFYDLRRHYETAEKYNIPLWTTLLSVGHFRYRPPTFDDFNWQLSTAIASGCCGILWFMFYLRAPHSNYRLAPIDIFGERTKTYYDLQYVLRQFHATYADIFTHLKLASCYHVGKAFGGYSLFEENSRGDILSAEACQGISGIISFFKDEQGADYIAIVNTSKTESGQIALKISDNVKAFLRQGSAFANADALKYFHDEGLTRGENFSVFTPWLAPGQMNLYRIQ